MPTHSVGRGGRSSSSRCAIGVLYGELRLLRMCALHSPHWRDTSVSNTPTQVHTLEQD